MPTNRKEMPDMRTKDIPQCTLHLSSTELLDTISTEIATRNLGLTIKTSIFKFLEIIVSQTSGVGCI